MIPTGSLVNVRGLAEFGVGKLNGYDPAGRPTVSFPTEGKKLLSPTATVSRVQLGPGTQVRCRIPQRESVVDAVVTGTTAPQADGLYIYRVQVDQEEFLVPEQDLLPVPAATDPLQSLKAFRWDAPKHYFARWSMADLMARWFTASGGFPAILGARVQPLGHQIYAARRVLFDRHPRFILADEVGLGKTIEAGLVIQSLQAEKPGLRVLILAPGSMSRQWLTEIYLRFGARAYTHIDARRLADLTLRQRTTLLAQPRLIVSVTALESAPELGTALAARDWDMIVIDEAHQYPPGSRLYGLFQQLAVRSKGLLLLSATPSKRDVQGLAGLLALVAPEAYRSDDAAGLQQRLDMQSHLWDRLNFTSKMIEATNVEDRTLDADELTFVAEEWAGLLDGDPMVAGFVSRMRGGDASATDELVAYVQEFHRLDHRIIRTRRANLRQPDLQWASRTILSLSYDPQPEEGMLLRHLEQLPTADGEAGAVIRCLYYRHCASTADNALRFLEIRADALERAVTAPDGIEPLNLLVSDPGPADEELILAQLLALPPLPGEEEWLARAVPLARAWRDLDRDGIGGRLEAVTGWLRTHLAEDDTHQVLLFVQDHAAAAQIAARLRAVFGDRSVAAFHSGLEEEELAAVAFRFQHDRNCRVLVSDELGGEGRNFQNASAVLHFDLPLSPSRLEQRIGRLDRVGRSAERPVLSVVVEGSQAAERALLAAHRHVFRVFEQSVGGLEFILPALQRRLAVAYGGGPDELDAAIPGLSAEVADALTAADEAFDLSLDATKPHLDAAIELALTMKDAVPEAEGGDILRHWASRLGLKPRESEAGINEFVWTNADLRVAIPALRVGNGAPDARRLARGTFLRERALCDESLQFFAPGHDLVDALGDQIQRGGHGRTTAFLLKGFPKHRGMVLLQVLARNAIDEALWPTEGMETGLAARARAALWPEVLPEVMGVWDPVKGARRAIITHPALRGLLDHPRDDLQLQSLAPSDVAQLPFLSELWDAVEAAVPAALASIRERRAPLVTERARQLEESLQGEIGFLSWKAARASAAEAKEVDQAIANRRLLVESVRKARVELLSLALVVLS